MKFVIIGPTISGNKGAAAMFESAVQSLNKRFPNSKFSLLSYYPKSDRKLNTLPDVEILNASPIRLAFILVPLSFIYGILKPFKFPNMILRKKKEIRALADADIILDEGGITFVDGREKYLPFNIACILPGIFMGKKIIKCSQALGPFKKPLNRFLARILLPRMSLIVARGEKTYEHLMGLKLKNVVLEADYAFSLRIPPQNEAKIKKYLSHKVFSGNKKVVGICPSSVIDNYYSELGKFYPKIMAEFIEYLIKDKNYNVAIIPHSVRKNTEKLKNNDLPVCNEIYRRIKQKDNCMYLEDEIGSQELRALIGKCDLFIASRFHSMVSSLAMEVPTLVIGWSHKYAEVLKMFDLEKYAFGYDKLDLETLKVKFEDLEKNSEHIKSTIQKYLPQVRKSADRHVEHIEKLLFTNPGKFKLGSLRDSTEEYYLGKARKYMVGYSLDENIRNGAASGGTITSILIHLLETNQIQGALVTKTKIKDGQLDYETHIATTKEEILAARTSVYYDVPVLSKIPEIKKFDGKVALVALPCQLKNLELMRKQDSELDEKIYLTIGMLCGHTSKRTLIQEILKKRGINEEDIAEFKFKTGLWRGRTQIQMKDGKKVSFPYNNYGTYQNLFFDVIERCIGCNDHTAEYSDISCGDVWNLAYKKSKIKHNAIIIRSQRAEQIIDEMNESQKLHTEEVTPRNIFKAQDRSLIYHKHIKARAKLGKLFGLKIPYDKNERARINDYLAAMMILLTIRAAKIKPLRKIIFYVVPQKIWYLYLVVFKVLTSF